MLTTPLRTKPLTKLQLNLIRAALLPTWQTAAAIAQHAGCPARTAITALKTNATEWQLETRLARIDGHNQVHMFRQRRMVQVMGVTVPMDDEEEEGGNG
jgi:3-hydroxyisobutyrate dehydrogenase-like beta-hydroxyacid dehydrogenase